MEEVIAQTALPAALVILVHPVMAHQQHQLALLAALHRKEVLHVLPVEVIQVTQVLGLLLAHYAKLEVTPVGGQAPQEQLAQFVRQVLSVLELQPQPQLQLACLVLMLQLRGKALARLA